VWNFTISPAQQPLKSTTIWTIMIDHNPENSDADLSADILHIRSEKVNQNEIENPSGHDNYHDNLDKFDRPDHIHQACKGLQ
jgi:hypothetical protein